MAASIALVVLLGAGALLYWSRIGAPSLGLALSAQKRPLIVKTDPPPGTIPYGVNVLVDDGTCGEGGIKQVTGAKAVVFGGRRIEKCVPYPK